MTEENFVELRIVSTPYGILSGHLLLELACPVQILVKRKNRK
jgi:hypothetical protein